MLYIGQLIKKRWAKVWMPLTGYRFFGRLMTIVASLFSPPYKGRSYLGFITHHPYFSPKSKISHKNCKFEGNAFIGDNVIIYEALGGGNIIIGKGVHIHRDCIIETGQGGSLFIDEDTHIQPRCQFSAYKGTIRIGRGVQIAPNCAFYPYNHGFELGKSIKSQPIYTKGGIVIGDDAWLGVGTIVLDGARIGRGAVIGAGSVVTTEVPDNAIAAGVPAKFLRYRQKGE